MVDGGDAMGVDIGGVIIQRTPGPEADDTSFWGDNFLATPAVERAFDALARLRAERYRDRLWIVSTCGEWTEQRTWEWLRHHQFFERTGVPPERVRFCRERRQKAPIAAELGLDVFVDDTPEVLGYLDMVPTRLLFDACPGDLDAFPHLANHVTPVASWADVEAALLA